MEVRDFVTYGLALKLKEKGFSEKCLYHYFDNKLVSNTCKSDNDNITTEDLLMSCNYLVSQFDTAGSNVVVSDAPTISQVLKWLREDKGVNIILTLWSNGWYVDIQSFDKEEDEEGVAYEVDYIFQSPDYETYEKAALAGIEYVIDNLI